MRPLILGIQADASAFGRVVSKRANEGGGWLTWVVSTDDLSPIENRLGRQAIDGSRKRPDGSELKWKQLGVLGTLNDSQLPFLFNGCLVITHQLMARQLLRL